MKPHENPQNLCTPIPIRTRGHRLIGPVVAGLKDRHHEPREDRFSTSQNRQHMDFGLVTYRCLYIYIYITVLYSWFIIVGL